MLKLLSAERGAQAVVRKYDHPRLGIFTVVTMIGPNGSADCINLGLALRQTRVLAETMRERDQRRGGSKRRKATTGARRGSKAEVAAGEPVDGPPEVA